MKNVIKKGIMKSFKFQLICLIFLGQRVRNTEKCVASVIRVYQQVKSIFHFHGPSSYDKWSLIRAKIDWRVSDSPEVKVVYEVIASRIKF